ncbi:DsbA family protein [Agrobacterium tumefaciens]|uniref:DsbA family protein n=1 Tax=Agrobacterium tumefaciens TaxID=358 RepID=UPI0005517142|nr:DsbA family protein [Agrobacterium tumefaciens]
MNDKKKITYLFDPLCGWCYGASGMLADISALEGIEVTLAPTGLFSGVGARKMDEKFSAYAWSNDERIGSLTGQRFTQDYRNNVLAKGGMLDSGPATLAVTAVALTEPSRELDALRLLQEARYVSGRDVTDMLEIRNILESAGLNQASDQLEELNADLLAANNQRIASARSLMAEFHVNGVPALIIDDGKHRGLVKANELFSNADVVAAISRLTTNSANESRRNHS